MLVGDAGVPQNGISVVILVRRNMTITLTIAFAPSVQSSRHPKKLGCQAQPHERASSHKVQGVASSCLKVRGSLSDFHIIHTS